MSTYGTDILFDKEAADRSERRATRAAVVHGHGPRRCIMLASGQAREACGGHRPALDRGIACPTPFGPRPHHMSALSRLPKLTFTSHHSLHLHSFDNHLLAVHEHRRGLLSIRIGVFTCFPWLPPLLP